MAARFEIHKSKNKQFYYTVVSKNGRILVTSEMYKTKSAVFTGMKSLTGAVASAAIRDRT